MRTFIDRGKRALAAFSAAAALLFPQIDSGAQTAPIRRLVSDEQYIAYVEDAIAWELGRVKSQTLSDGYLSAGLEGSSEADWFMLAERSLGIADGYEDYTKAAVIPDAAENELLTEAARRNVTTALLGGRGKDMSGCELSDAGCNEIIWVILAQRLNGYDDEKAVELLEKMQHKDGGFGFESSDADITAMALTVLGGEAAQRAEQWLVSSYDGGMSCETAAWYIIGECSRGTDIANSTDFSDADGKRPIDVLIECHNPDGGFSHNADGESDVLSTAQALTALAALAEYNAGGGGLFDGRPAKVDIYDQTDICGRLAKEDKLRLAKIGQMNSEIRSGFYPPESVNITQLPYLMELNDRIEQLDPQDREYVLSADELIEREKKLKKWSVIGIVFGITWKIAAFIAFLKLRKTAFAARLKEKYLYGILNRLGIKTGGRGIKFIKGRMR